MLNRSPVMEVAEGSVRKISKVLGWMDRRTENNWKSKLMDLDMVKPVVVWW